MKVQKYVTFVKKRLKINILKNKHLNVKGHCLYTCEYRGAAHSICKLKYSIRKETTIIFHNRASYIYYFIIKELPKKFEGQLTCLVEKC